MRRLTPAVLALTTACAHGPPTEAGVQTPPSPSSTEDGSVVVDPELRQIVDDHWEWTRSEFPEFATRIGDHRFDDRLTDRSREAVLRRRRQRRDFLARLDVIPPERLTERDRVNRQMLILELEGEVEAERCRFEEWSLSPRSNPVTRLNYLPLANLEPTPRGARALLARYRASAVSVDREIAQLERGAADGLFPNAESTRRVLAMVEEQLAQPVTEWPMYTEAEPMVELAPEGAEAYRAELLRVLGDEVRPALERYQALLAERISPRARGPHEPVGLSGLPFGEACYRARIRHYTTLDLEAREIHETGLREIERINAEMATLGRRIFETESLAETLAELRTHDPRLYFDDREAIIQTAESALARAKAAIPDYFGRLPRADCVVREIPAYEAPFTTVAYYRQPVPGGGRPGEYYVNTYQPETRTRYEAEALAFHESIPGHHLQIAIAQELEGLPPFRRHLGMTAFVEGWALYAEALADEMGLYSGDLDRLGRLSYEAWRAARLVVDTGIHALGWSRQRAKRFMLEHTALAPNNIDNEVDRYIVWPGQALAYKTGQLEIAALRAEAEARLGEAFDLPSFHDAVLGGGAVSLPILRAQIEDWIEARAR